MYLNMSCGQTFLSPTCLKRMEQQLNEPIYYPKYYEMEIETVSMLKKVFQTQNTTLLVTGTGTYGIEMGLRSTFEAGEKVLVIDTGIFGAVGASILEAVGLEPVVLKFAYGEPVDLNRVREAVNKDTAIKGLYAVHDETTTGAIQPIKELGEICRENGLIFGVDAISSISGVPLETDAWGIDLCFGSAQKCMNGPQGLVLVAVSDRVYEKMAHRKTPITSLSLDLQTWTRYHEVKVKGYLDWWKTGGPLPEFPSRAPHEVSPSATLVQGLHGALEDILAEGMEERIIRHEKAGTAMRAAVKAMGLSMVIQDEAIASDVVTVIKLPNGINERVFREYLLNTYKLALGNGEIGQDNVRIGTMGITASAKYILPTVGAIGAALNHFGAKCDAGAGLDAASKVLYAE